jgi:hypothetical protein
MVAGESSSASHAPRATLRCVLANKYAVRLTRATSGVGMRIMLAKIERRMLERTILS